MAEVKKEGKVKEGVRILKCTCEHEFQDQLYGKGMRVHNVTKDGDAACTVCVPNLKINKMNPADDIPSSPAFKNAFIPKKKDRSKYIKKVV